LTDRACGHPTGQNRNIAAGFLYLHFALESKHSLPVFTRLDGPHHSRLDRGDDQTDGTGSGQDALPTHLWSKTRLPVQHVPSNAQTSITIKAVTQSDICKALPRAARFVVPNVSSLAESRRDRDKPEINWALLCNREQMRIFIPNNTRPQEVWNCLHEELAWAEVSVGRFWPD